MNVWPTNSGTIVQARAQVLIGSFLFDRVHQLHLAVQLRIDKRPFLFRTSHDCLPTDSVGYVNSYSGILI